MSESVEFGIYVPQVALTFDQTLRRAQLCETLGFHSFWLFDHLYTPDLPQYPALEGWTLASALAARTSRLRIGHLVTNNNLRHPALLAKMATTLDVISGGRLELGLGSGSYEAEHDEAGITWGTLAERSARLQEALEIVTRMLVTARTTFNGRYYRVHDLPNLPPPVQSPHPPLHIGGIGERYTLPLVARYADVWNVPTYGLDRLSGASAALDAACHQVGRDPGTLRRSLASVLVLAANEAGVRSARAVAARRYPGDTWHVDVGGFVGTPDRIVERVHHYVDEGISLFIFFPFDRGEEETLRLLAEEVLPHFHRPSSH